MTLKAVEFYSGIGGLHRALQSSNVDATVVRAFDWDQMSCRVYEANHGPGIVKKTDISTLTASDLLDVDAPLWLLSPSCQPFTVLNPNAKGDQDPRAKSFLHLVQNVIPELARIGHAPKWILIENVAGFETSSTRHILTGVLDECNYNILELLLTPLQFGIPNSRLRYYLLAKLQPLQFSNAGSFFEDESRTILRYLPGNGVPCKDNRKEYDATQLKVYLDRNGRSDDTHPCKIPDRVLLKWGRLFDIVLPSSRRSCCFTRGMPTIPDKKWNGTKRTLQGYTHLVERAGSILQMNEGLDTKQTFDEFLALQEQSTPSTAETQQLSEKDFLSTLVPLQLRYFSPSELLRLFHFEPPIESDETRSKVPGFKWPTDITWKSKYRLLGNSVNVEVVRRVVNYLFEKDN